MTFLAWAIARARERTWSLNEGTFAVMLLFAWYINRGLVRHTVEDSFTRNVVFEYVALRRGPGLPVRVELPAGR